MRRSDTGSNSAWTTYGLMTGTTWKRPSSNTRAENPVLWCEPRIFWTRIRRWIREDEGRRAEVPQPLEQAEQLRPAVLEFREDLERLERVDHDEVDAVDVFLRRHRPPEELHPRLRRALPDLFLNRADIEDVDVRADRLDVEPHRGHLALEARSRLFQGDVQAFRVPLPRVRVED